MSITKYPYVYVVRSRGFVQVYPPGEKPVPEAWDWPSLQSLCLAEFERVFHWLPEKDVMFKMRVYFDAEEVL